MAPGLKHKVIAAGFAGIAAIGADRWLAPIARGRGIILMFHHVRPRRDDAFQPNALLEITPDFLDRVLTLVAEHGYDFVGMDEVPGRLARGGPPFAALTFDDGYRDNVDHAMPVLERHGVPWTLFVTTDYASGTGRLWWIELEEVVRRRAELDLVGEGAVRRIAARTPGEKGAAFAAAYRMLRAGPEARLRDTLARWCEETGIDTSALVQDLCLGWDDLVRLAERPGVTLGAHTLTHPMLAKHPRAFAEREIRDPRTLLADRFGREIRHIAYPVGDPGSAGPREFGTARDAGYATGVTTRPGHLHPGHAVHPTALPRVSVNGLFQSDAAIRALLSGVPFLLWNRGRRLNVA